MKKIFKFKGKVKKHEASATETAEFLIEAFQAIKHVAPAFNTLLEELSWALRMIHQDFGNWEKFSNEVPENLKVKLQDQVNDFQGEDLEYVSGLSMLLTKVFDRFVSGEDHMAHLERFHKLFHPEETI